MREFKELLGWCWPALFTFAVLVLLALVTADGHGAAAGR